MGCGVDLLKPGMKTLQIPGEINALVEELRQIRTRMKGDEARQTEITTKLKEHTGQQPAMLRFNKDVVAMLEEDTQRRIDSDRLKAKYPEIAAECSKTLTFLRVKVVQP